MPKVPTPPSKEMQAILDALAEMIGSASDQQQQELGDAIIAYENKRFGTLAALKRTPAFRHLWDVLREESGAAYAQELDGK